MGGSHYSWVATIPTAAVREPWQIYVGITIRNTNTSTSTSPSIVKHSLSLGSVQCQSAVHSDHLLFFLDSRWRPIWDDYCTGG